MTSSHPLLSPHLPRAPEITGSPLRALASVYPSGAAVSAMMLLVVGAWLCVSPFALGYAEYAQGRSDLASGALIILFALVALAVRRPWVSWLAGCVGLWLLVAPIALWSPSFAAYANATLTGLLVIAEALLRLTRRLPGPAVPPGWSYNPTRSAAS